MRYAGGMSEYRIEESAVVAAPPRRVWALLADVTTWPEWSEFDAAELEAPGSPDRDGAGAIRRYRLGRRITRERVTAFEPERRLAYELLSGVRVRDYRAEVTLTPVDGGTRVTWRAGFHGVLPGQGAVVRFVLARFIRRLVGSLAAHLAPR